MRLVDRWSRRAGYWEGLASGAAVFTQSYGATPDREATPPQLAAWAQSVYQNNGIVFAAAALRLMLFSEASFRLRAKDDKHLYSNQSLALLQTPFGDDTSELDLLKRLEQDATSLGNAYIWGAPGEDRLVRLRPEWTTIVSELVHAAGGSYRRKVGYWVEPPKNVTGEGDPQLYPAEEVAHWAPYPDPFSAFRGMSWLTPVYREVMSDEGLTKYKIRYLDNAASPNMLIKYDQKLQPGTIDAVRERMQARYGGVDNAFKTLVLDQGADATVIGNSLQQMDFTNVESAGEQRILAASGVPGVLIGLEPLRGAGRGYQEALQKLANMVLRPNWRSACAVLEKFVPDLPGGAELWFDTADIQALQDGEMERAQTALVKAQALLALVQGGYDRMSAVSAVESLDYHGLQAAAVPAGAPMQGAGQHLLPQAQPGATAQPLPPTNPRLTTGSVSPGDGGNGTRPIARPAAARRAITVNGHG